MLKRLPLLSVLVAALFTLCGCLNPNNLPLVSGDRFEYHRSSPVSSAHIVAEGVSITETEVRADSVVVEVNYPVVGTATLTVTNYKRDRKGNTP